MTIPPDGPPGSADVVLPVPLSEQPDPAPDPNLGAPTIPADPSPFPAP